jgi:hypothetical protein
MEILKEFSNELIKKWPVLEVQLGVEVELQDPDQGPEKGKQNQGNLQNFFFLKFLKAIQLEEAMVTIGPKKNGCFFLFID